MAGTRQAAAHGMDGTGEGAMLATWLLCTAPLLVSGLKVRGKHDSMARAFFARSVACHCALVWTCNTEVLRN
ncbi:uncharacterized protein SCHCODRAFT_02639169 [Schizophyllum commune H4-8]|uniref:uncharacterized protein n=1 Tax=Schizophyllum commune (strain H4-8 / FGSC 9210) TaxID=578458 RepID=UPI002160041D|nr:uncharacterized protein SCHCODRAFT_02639169 [Schizophyllum commune H4-8]KAI5887894.1 hypothetical protein SCHCODRAFT_02639169 [Schizophyllum commune H4-8]